MDLKIENKTTNYKTKQLQYLSINDFFQHGNELYVVVQNSRPGNNSCYMSCLNLNTGKILKFYFVTDVIVCERVSISYTLEKENRP